MNGKFVIFLLLISAIALSGCVENIDATNFVKSQPEVQAFLAENPDADITAVFLVKESISPFLESMREQCGQQMQEDSYWYVTVTKGAEKLEIYLDETGQQALCVIKPGVEQPEPSNYEEPPTPSEPPVPPEPPVQQDKCSSVTECNDNNPCTADSCIGTPRSCANTQIIGCASGDGCCLSNCTFQNDTDCEEVKECPASCDDDNPCTTDSCSESTGFECNYSNLNGAQTGCEGSAGTCVTKTCSEGDCIQQTTANCCGNGECEPGESYDNCPADCETEIIEGKIQDNEFVGGLEGKGEYADDELMIKFKHLAVLNPKWAAPYKAWVELYDNSGTLISSIIVSEGDDLSEKFIDSKGNYALKDRVTVKKIEYQTNGWGGLTYEISGKNEGECSNCLVPKGEFYRYEDIISNLDGKGEYDNQNVNLKFVDITASSPVDNAFNGLFELYAADGSLIDKKFGNKNTDLSEWFAAGTDYALKTRVKVMELFYNPNGIGYVLIEKTGENDTACGSSSVCDNTTIAEYYRETDTITGLTGTGDYAGEPLLLKVNRVGLYGDGSEDYYEIELILYTQTGQAIQKQTFTHGAINLHDEFPIEDWMHLQVAFTTYSSGDFFIIVERLA